MMLGIGTIEFIDSLQDMNIDQFIELMKLFNWTPIQNFDQTITKKLVEKHEKTEIIEPPKENNLFKIKKK